ncbi:MAG: DUF4214 domain-containing protein, partial [Rhodoplanes sp.]
MADVNFVQGLYRNVLARDPDAEGANYWNSQIANGATHDEVTVAFLNSVEAQTVINPVVRLYEGLLNRAPDVDGLKYWADALRGGRSLNDITNDFLNSPEAIENGFDPDPNNLSDEAFVTKLYEAMGRTPEQIAADTDGVQYWLNALNTETMSRAQVAQGFMESAENQQDTDGFVTGWGALRAAGNPGPTTTQLEDFSTEVVFVDSLYRNVLARDPDAGANAEVAQIASGATHDQVKVAFLNSTETQTVINPVVRLYEGLLNRAPDVDGLKYWADALRGGRSLNDITNDFLNSPEGIAKGFGDDIGNATFVNNLYLSMGRDQAQIDADSDGVSFWLNALNTETMSRAQVAQGFMESAENQQ